MQTRKINKKAHQVSAVLIAVALIISVFSIGFWTEGNGKNNINGAVMGMDKVTGF